MKKALIFGAAGVGAEVKRRFEKQGICVTAFSDNAKWKWGRQFEKCRIIPPDEIIVSEYDIFAIGVLGAVQEIKKQLIEMGVNSEKIVVPVDGFEKVFLNDKIKVMEPTSDKCIVLVLGGIKNFDTEMKRYFEKEEPLHFDFMNNIWAFRYFVEDCIYTAEILGGENYFEQYPITKLDALVVDAYIVDDCLMDDMSEKGNGLLVCRNNYRLQKMLTNKNTFNFYMERLPRPFDEEVLKNIEAIKIATKKYNLPMEEICIVSGTVLQLYGLRDGKPEDDLDVIMTSRFRDLYGKGPVTILKQVEMHSQNELLLNRYLEQELSDDQIIDNDEFHFRFRGCKFLRLDLLYEQKRNINRQSEVKLMEYFFRNLNR